MALSVNTNTQSLFAQRALNMNTTSMQKSIERLSTGFKINRAGDDAAGLTISEKLTAKIRGLEKAKQNIGDGISLIQTAEGSLSIVSDNLQRIRELMVQAANGTNSTNEKNAIQREINERVTVISDIYSQVSFNGNNLLQGGSNFSLQTGADNGQYTTLNFQSGATGTGINISVGATSGILGSIAEGAIQLNTIHVGGSVNANAGTSTTTGTVGNVDTAIDNLSRMRSYLGAMQNSLESKLEYLSIAVENNSASRSRIKDVDVAEESSVLTRNQILQQTASAMLSQANSAPQVALSLLPRG